MENRPERTTRILGLYGDGPREGGSRATVRGQSAGDPTPEKLVAPFRRVNVPAGGEDRGRVQVEVRSRLFWKAMPEDS